MNNSFNTNGFNMNNFNNFLKKAQTTLLCGPDCQKEKTSKQLEQDYLNAQTNEKMSQYNVQTTEKKYITFTKGASGYNELQTNALSSKAEQIATVFLDNFNNDVNKTKYDIDTYSGLLTNYNNVYELYFNYVHENKSLEKRYEDEHSDVTTNDRKTYYENQEIDFLNLIYKYMLLGIYIITVIVYFFSVFLYSSPFNWKMRFLILVFLIILPFISTWLLGAIVYLIYKIYELLPKNVFKRL